MKTLEATSITHSFQGRFGFGIDQWAYVPFDVPAGIQRIDVSTSHDRFSLIGVARNVLDLGIFGPAGHDLGNAEGFRGWSGGARSGFTLSATDATPGYLAGPIDPGTWALALGPVVLNPLGMDWQATIELHHGAVPPIEPGVAHGSVARRYRGSGWYRGDLHLHTIHSDGQHTIDDMVEAAMSAGLDFIVSTDHNTNSANRAWPAAASGDLTVIAGEEVTTRHGHWLAIGLTPGGWVDWRYAPRDDVFARYAAQVRADGGMVVAAHPAVPLPGSAWEFGYHGVDALEVWNGLWNVDDELSLRLWHQQLRNGRRIVAVGGSDSHGPYQPVGRPQTVVYTDDLSPRNLISAIRRGRCYVAESSAITLALNASLDNDTATACPGETLRVPPGARLAVTATVQGAPDASIALITDAGCVRRARTDDSGVGTVQWTAAGDSRFARVEVRRAVRGRFPSMLALTNPVWLTQG
jgi:PHP domain